MPRPSARALAQCKLGGSVKQVVYIQLDNVHFRRDNPNVPSDLEQMPNLLNFLEGNGAFLTNHWTPLISQGKIHLLIEIMTDGAVPATLQQHRATFGRLASTYKAINAPLGTLGMKTLQNTTAAIQGNDATYIGYFAQLKALTGQRNSIAGNMIRMMEASEIGGIQFNDIAANVRVTLGQDLLASVP